MAVQFKPLKLEDTDLFGVSLSGPVSRSDSDRLRELADKCLLKGKVNLVLDLSELGSMGGGGARMIAELQERLVAADGGAIIAGAGDTVRRFLDQKIKENPLTYYDSVDEAIREFGCGKIATEVMQVATAVAEPEIVPEVEPATSVLVSEKIPPIGEPDAPELLVDTGSAEMDTLLGDFKVAETHEGRRKDHHFTSLDETLEILSSWSDRTSQMEFSQALKNLLFSQGLAEDVTLLIAKGGLMVSPDGYKEIPLDGALATQAEQVARPMTLLDIQDDDLSEEEISLLEAVDPDMILPVLRRGVIDVLILIKKGGQDREYSVSESFAFELMQQILERTSAAKAAMAKLQALQAQTIKGGAPASATIQKDSQEHLANLPAMPSDASAIMLRMSLDLPEAEDLPHFWRLFSRHLQPMMELKEMAFLAAGRNHPQLVLGGDSVLVGMDCAEERIQKYFRAMELPVRVENFPTTFASTKADLLVGKVDWIIALKWQSEFLGTLFVNGEAKNGGDFSKALLEVFNLAGRLLVRFEGRNDNANVYLDLINRLITQREKRFFGSDDLTNAIVDQLHQLAMEMGFPPDQKRDLIYGCLLRDIGLIDKDDALMGSPADMTPNQWKAYRNHPTEGAALLADLNLSQTVLEVVKCHHERFNGEGFPSGLSGRDIPLAARVVTVVENFVSMTAGAGGMPPRSTKEAAEALRQNLGERYDPDIVGIFLSVVQGA